MEISRHQRELGAEQHKAQIQRRRKGRLHRQRQDNGQCQQLSALALLAGTSPQHPQQQDSQNCQQEQIGQPPQFVDHGGGQKIVVPLRQHHLREQFPAPDRIQLD